MAFQLISFSHNKCTPNIFNEPKMNWISVTTLLLLSVHIAMSATCVYDQSANTVNCRGQTCSTVGQVQGGKLPRGYYLVGKYYLHGSARTPWFNFYPKRSAGGYWDYYTRVAELGCRGGFGLHPGSASLGCITVKDRSCFNKIKDVLLRFPVRTFDVKECRNCVFGRCLRGEGDIRGQRQYLTDLQVVG